MKTKVTNNLYVERAKLRITQEDLAKKIGTTRQTIHLLESGKTDPKLSLALKIAGFFKVRVTDIFGYQK